MTDGRAVDVGFAARLVFLLFLLIVVVVIVGVVLLVIGNIFVVVVLFSRVLVCAGDDDFVGDVGAARIFLSRLITHDNRTK